MRYYVQVIAHHTVTQKDFWNLCEQNLPGFDYALSTSSPDPNHSILQAFFHTPEAAANAREELHGIEYPEGWRLVAIYKGQFSNVSSVPAAASDNGGKRPALLMIGPTLGGGPSAVNNDSPPMPPPRGRRGSSSPTSSAQAPTEEEEEDQIKLAHMQALVESLDNAQSQIDDAQVNIEVARTALKAMNIKSPGKNDIRVSPTPKRKYEESNCSSDNNNTRSEVLGFNKDLLNKRSRRMASSTFTPSTSTPGRAQMSELCRTNWSKSPPPSPPYSPRDTPPTFGSNLFPTTTLAQRPSASYTSASAGGLMVNIKQEVVDQADGQIQLSEDVMRQLLEEEEAPNDPRRLCQVFLWGVSSQLVSTNWKALGRTLGLDESVLTNIEVAHKPNGLRECSYNVLIEWRQRFPHLCYFGSLYKILKNEGLNLAAREMLEYSPDTGRKRSSSINSE